MKHIEVAAAAIINDGKVFCAQRGNKGELAGKWEFPGGKLEAGEQPEQALAREIREELGIDIAVGQHIATVEHTYQSFSITMHAFLCTIRSGTITLTEHLDSRWLANQELDQPDWAAADVPVAQALQEIL